MYQNKEISEIMKICPNGHKVDCGANFCPVCGSKTHDIGGRFCTNCGCERKENDRFCSQCGMPFGYCPVEKKKEDDFSFFGFLWIDD